MLRKRSARALAGGLVIVLLLVAAAAAYAAVTGHFSGKTNQRQSISFDVAHGRVTHLQFRIRDTCPNGHVYSIHDYGFQKIAINKFHKFDQTFVSPVTGRPTAAVRITGTVGPKEVTGQLLDIRAISGESHTCQGKTRYTAHKAVGA